MVDSGCVEIRKQSQGLSLNNWSHKNTMKDHMFPRYPLEALYLHGHTAFKLNQVIKCCVHIGQSNKSNSFDRLNCIDRLNLG